jgi:tetratricopeptide (TPR) repeat protein
LGGHGKTSLCHPPEMQPADAVSSLTADALKSMGNAHFTAGRLDLAIESYSSALALSLAGSPLLPQLHANLAAVYLAKHDFESALRSAKAALAVDGNFTKAHYRMGVALIGLRRPAEALAALTIAARLDTSSESIQQALHEAEAMQRQADSTDPVTSVPQFAAVFSRARDPRLRLATLATFWNTLDANVRWAVFCRFLELMIGPSAVTEPVPLGHTGPHVSQFDQALLTALPMDNYVDVSVPAPWVAFFDALAGAERVQLFNAAWDLCSEIEQGLIMQDLHAFFNPVSDADDTEAAP